MKTLIFLLMGFYCFANGQNDSLKMITQRLEQVNSENKALLKQTDKSLDVQKVLIKENQTLRQRFIRYFKTLVSNKSNTERTNLIRSLTAVKSSNVNEPIEEIILPDGSDTIRGSLFYRLFHKNKFYLKPYKLIENEKVYLD